MRFQGTGETMKKIGASLIILLVFAGFVFYFGWTSYAVPAGSYGVLTSKTGGVDGRVVESGVFRWNWERLLPTNARIVSFIVAPRSMPIMSEGTLPSGALYADVIDGNPDFKWKIGGTVSATVNPTRLPSLVRDEGINDQAGLDAWIERRIESLIEKEIRETLTVAISDGSNAVEGLSDFIALGELIAEKILAAGSGDLSAVSLTISSLSIPDIDLYRLARTTYLAYLEEKTRLYAKTSTEEAGLAVSDRYTIDRFEKWGELLTKYPILIEFLALTKGDPAAALVKIKD